MWLIKYYVKLQAKKIIVSEESSKSLLKKIFKKLKLEDKK